MMGEDPLVTYTRNKFSKPSAGNSSAKQAKDALLEVYEMFMRHPELQEIDGSFPRGSVFGIVKAALERFDV